MFITEPSIMVKIWLLVNRLNYFCEMEINYIKFTFWRNQLSDRSLSSALAALSFFLFVLCVRLGTGAPGSLAREWESAPAAIPVGLVLRSAGHPPSLPICEAAPAPTRWFRDHHPPYSGMLVFPDVLGYRGHTGSLFTEKFLSHQCLDNLE